MQKEVVVDPSDGEKPIYVYRRSCTRGEEPFQKLIKYKEEAVYLVGTRLSDDEDELLQFILDVDREGVFTIHFNQKCRYYLDGSDEHHYLKCFCSRVEYDQVWAKYYLPKLRKYEDDDLSCSYLVMPIVYWEDANPETDSLLVMEWGKRVGVVPAPSGPPVLPPPFMGMSRPIMPPMGVPRGYGSMPQFGGMPVLEPVGMTSRVKCDLDKKGNSRPITTPKGIRVGQKLSTIQLGRNMNQYTGYDPYNDVPMNEEPYMDASPSFSARRFEDIRSSKEEEEDTWGKPLKINLPTREVVVPASTSATIRPSSQVVTFQNPNSMDTSEPLPVEDQATPVTTTVVVSRTEPTPVVFSQSTLASGGTSTSVTNRSSVLNPALEKKKQKPAVRDVAPDCPYTKERHAWDVQTIFHTMCYETRAEDEIDDKKIVSSEILSRVKVFLLTLDSTGKTDEFQFDFIKKGLKGITKMDKFGACQEHFLILVKRLAFLDPTIHQDESRDNWEYLVLGSIMAMQTDYKYGAQVLYAYKRFFDLSIVEKIRENMGKQVAIQQVFYPYLVLLINMHLEVKRGTGKKLLKWVDNLMREILVEEYAFKLKTAEWFCSKAAIQDNEALLEDIMNSETF